MKFIFFTIILFINMILLLIISFGKLFTLKEDLLIENGKYREAIDRLLVLIRKKTDKWKYHFSIAYSSYMIGENSQAIEHFERVLNLNIKSLKSYFYLSILFAEKKNFYQALFYFDNGVSILKKFFFSRKVKDFEINDIKGWIYYKKGELNKAIECYEKAINEAEKKIKIRKERKLKKYTEDDHLFDQLDLKPKTPMFFRFGVICLEQNKKDEARKYFERAVEYGGSENIFSIKAKEELKKM